MTSQILFSPMIISPEAGSSKPAISLKSVVFPLPLGPNKLTTSPFLMLKLKFLIELVFCKNDLYYQFLEIHHLSY